MYYKHMSDVETALRCVGVNTRASWKLKDELVVQTSELLVSGSAFRVSPGSRPQPWLLDVNSPSMCNCHPLPSCACASEAATG